MVFPSIRKLGVLCLVALPAALSQQAAMASSATHSFTTNSGKTFTIARTSTFDPSTRISTKTVSETGPKGKTASASVTSTPDGQGGVTVSRSFTGLNGQTHTSSHTYGH